MVLTPRADRVDRCSGGLANLGFLVTGRRSLKRRDDSGSSDCAERLRGSLAHHAVVVAAQQVCQRGSGRLIANDAECQGSLGPDPRIGVSQRIA